MGGNVGQEYGETVGAAICPMCKAEFTCGASLAERCWCANLPRVMTPVDGQSCWCRACLKKQIEQKQSTENHTY